MIGLDRQRLPLRKRISQFVSASLGERPTPTPAVHLAAAQAEAATVTAATAARTRVMGLVVAGAAVMAAKSLIQ